MSSEHFRAAVKSIIIINTFTENEGTARIKMKGRVTLENKIQRTRELEIWDEKFVMVGQDFRNNDWIPLFPTYIVDYNLRWNNNFGLEWVDINLFVLFMLAWMHAHMSECVCALFNPFLLILRRSHWIKESGVGLRVNILARCLVSRQETETTLIYRNKINASV